MSADNIDTEGYQEALETEKILRTWVGLASHFIAECFDLAKPFIDINYLGIDPLVRFVAAQLFIDCHLSSESVLLLLQAQKEWDGDLVARAVMEGSIKFTYMLHGNGEEVKAKVHEYWKILPLFTAVRRSERAKGILKALPTPEAAVWQPFRDVVMTEPSITAIRERYKRQERQALEEKWSFAGICKAFVASNDPKLTLLIHLAHGYGMSSHLLHKDGDGVGMVWDRYRRAPERQTAAKLAHSARIVSDLCAFAKLRLLVLLETCQAPTLAIADIEKRFELLFSEIEKANQHFSRVEYGIET